MEVKPLLVSSDKEKIKHVNELSLIGEYKEEKFFDKTILNVSDLKQGYVNFSDPQNTGYDRRLYETLKNDNAKKLLACHSRVLEIGDYKDDKLHGFGARYLDNTQGYVSHNWRTYDDLILSDLDTKIIDNLKFIGLIGRYEDGVPNGNLIYYEQNAQAIYGDHAASIEHYTNFKISNWDNGKLIKISNSFIRKKDKKKFNKSLIKEFVVEDIFWLDGKEKMHYDFEFSHVDQKFWNAYEDASGNILDLLIKIELG